MTKPTSSFPIPTADEVRKHLAASVDSAKILTWIRRGELRAVNVATTTNGRPRFRISPVDLAAFELARAAGPQPKITRIRRGKDPSVIEFF